MINPSPQSGRTLFEALIAQAAKQFPQADFDSVLEAIYAGPLQPDTQQQFVQLLDFVRSQQIKNPIYETIYHHLLFSYVLNGSRLELLKNIDRRLRGLVLGQGALLLISGVSGIGKTSLVMAFQERIQQIGAMLIVGRCSEDDQASYAVWQGVAQAISAAGFLLETLPAPLGPGREAQSAQHIKQALADWLTACSKRQPFVILLDDLHWADLDSLEVLNFLTRQPVSAPILFVATYRNEETHLKHALYEYLPYLQHNRIVDLLLLGPLGRADVERLITAYHGVPTPESVTYLYERAEGHPLFTVELLNNLVAQNLLIQDREGRWLPPSQAAAIPAYLKQLITQRVNRLGVQVEQLLSVAAVAGEAWSLKIVEELVNMPEDDLLEAVECALRAEIILSEDDREEIYRFSHGLIRQVLYTNQLARRRKRLHEQIAAQYEQQQPANVFAIAHHATEAEQWEKAAAYCQTAGELAAQRYASYSALQWYQQALTAAERAGKTYPLKEIFAIYERLGRTHMALGQREQAEIIYSRMRDVAQSGEDLIAEGYALISLANARMRRYQLVLAEKTGFEALRIGEQTGDLRLIISCHACLGGLLIARGELEQVTRHYREVMKHAEVLGDSLAWLDALRMNAYLATWHGKYQQAEMYARQTLQLAQNINDPLAIAGAYQNLAFVQIEKGQYFEAYHTLRTTLDTIEASGSHHHQKPRLLNQMGHLHLELGMPQEALAWDQKALDAIQDVHFQSIEMRRYSLLNQATDYLHLGMLEAAQDTLARFEAVKEGAEFVRFRYFNRYQLLICELGLQQQQFDQAIALAQEARALAQSKGVLKNIARSHWFEGQALAGLMRFDEAVEHLERAVEFADGIQHGALRWKTRLSLAETLHRAGRPADDVLGRVRDLIDQMAQSLSGSPLQEGFLVSSWVERLHALEGQPTPEAATYPAGLTRREVEILQLVAKGASNQQVADTLRISVRTVNTHMTNILNKTGLENRTAASAFAIQHHLAST